MVVEADGAGRGAGAPTLSTARTEHAFDNSDSAAIRLAGRFLDHASGQRQPDHLYARYVFKRTGDAPSGFNPLGARADAARGAVFFLYGLGGLYRRPTAQDRLAPEDRRRLRFDTSTHTQPDRARPRMRASDGFVITHPDGLAVAG